jgi:hypothetical protein
MGSIFDVGSFCGEALLSVINAIFLLECLYRFLFAIDFRWIMLLEREHESGKNNSTQNSGCKPRSISIETSDCVACHWSTSLYSRFF